MANTISDSLKLTEVLEAAIVGFRQALLPLRLFSHAVSKDPGTGGNDDNSTITVPVYSFTSGDAQSRSAGTAYSSLASSTSTSARQISVNKEKVVGISFTNEEAARQVAFNPELHGMIKGRDLAKTVIDDIASRIRYGYFPNATIAPTTSGNFDVADVATLGQYAMEANWPEMPRPGMVLNPEYHFALLQRSQIIGADVSGSTAALRQAKINEIMLFDEVGSNAVPLNNGLSGTGGTFTAATTDICTRADHGFLSGDQVLLTTTTTLPAGLSAATYYYVQVIDDDTFKLCTTLAAAVGAGTAVDVTDTGTGTHTVTLTTNMVGFVAAPSAIITGFRPVLPTPAIRAKLFDFQLVEDPESDLVLEYRHFADEDTGKEFQMIGCHYGYEYGIGEALKIISKTAA